MILPRRSKIERIKDQGRYPLQPRSFREDLSHVTDKGRSLLPSSVGVAVSQKNSNGCNLKPAAGSNQLGTSCYRASLVNFPQRSHECIRRTRLSQGNIAGLHEPAEIHLSLQYQPKIASQHCPTVSSMFLAPEWRVGFGTNCGSFWRCPRSPCCERCRVGRGDFRFIALRLRGLSIDSTPHRKVLFGAFWRLCLVPGASPSFQARSTTSCQPRRR